MKCQNYFMLFTGGLLVLCHMVGAVPVLEDALKCGDREYIKDDSCVACPVCNAGEELNGNCGGGFADTDIGCVECEEGEHSEGGVDAMCTPCDICFLSHEIQTCTRFQNRECGECFQGYFREENSPLCIECLEEHKMNLDPVFDTCRSQTSTDGPGLPTSTETRVQPNATQIHKSTKSQDITKLQNPKSTKSQDIISPTPSGKRDIFWIITTLCVLVILMVGTLFCRKIGPADCPKDNTNGSGRYDANGSGCSQRGQPVMQRQNSERREETVPLQECGTGKEEFAPM